MSPISRFARITAAHCNPRSRLGAAVVFLALAVAAAACGTVDTAPQSAKNDAGGDSAAGGTGSSTTGGAAGGAGQDAGGAGGEAGRGGAGGQAATGGAGGASSGGAAGGVSSGGAGVDGAGNHPWTAPACKASEVGTPCLEPDGGYVELTVDGGIPGSGVNSWRCESDCKLTQEPATPCTSMNNHVYCVARCSLCR